MATIIDIGGGQSVPRHHLPKKLLRELDDASATISQTQARIRSWIRPLHPLQAPANFSGDVICNAPNQSGRSYTLSEPGAALLIDDRDLTVFSALKFTAVPSGSPPTDLRVGLVFMDTEVGGYMRWNGAAWLPITLE